MSSGKNMSVERNSPSQLLQMQSQRRSMSRTGSSWPSANTCSMHVCRCRVTEVRQPKQTEQSSDGGRDSSSLSRMQQTQRRALQSGKHTWPDDGPRRRCEGQRTAVFELPTLYGWLISFDRPLITKQTGGWCGVRALVHL